MNDHPYLCECSGCQYQRMLRIIREKYDLNDPFRPPEDPFPPTAGRFKVNHPPYEQKPRDWRRHRPSKIGKFRRVKDQAFDTLNFQYQPWPSHEWVTYYSITMEQMHRAGMTNQIAAVQWLMGADKAMQERRFYKIERIDEAAKA